MYKYRPHLLMIDNDLVLLLMIWRYDLTIFIFMDTFSQIHRSKSWFWLTQVSMQKAQDSQQSYLEWWPTQWWACHSIGT